MVEGQDLHAGLHARAIGRGILLDAHHAQRALQQHVLAMHLHIRGSQHQTGPAASGTRCRRRKNQGRNGQQELHRFFSYCQVAVRSACAWRTISVSRSSLSEVN